MKKLISVVFVVALSGCGQGVEAVAPDGGTTTKTQSAPSALFAGTFTGPSTATITGLGTDSWAGTLVGSVAASSATFTKLCPDGGGSLVVSGSGTSLSWSGTLACNPVAFTGCSAVVFTFTAGTFTAKSDGTLAVIGQGTGVGCGTTRTFSMTFNGSK